MVTVIVDGEPVAELGPGAVLGERAVLEGGRRTSDGARASRTCKVAVASPDQIDREALVASERGTTSATERRPELEPSERTIVSGRAHRDLERQLVEGPAARASRSGSSTPQPDVLCLQETKLADKAFPSLTLPALGYDSVHHGQGQWNGVAILSRVGIDRRRPAASATHAIRTRATPA